METVELVGTVCDGWHGTPDNSASFYGHGGRSDVCVRAGDVWVRDIRKLAVVPE